MSATLIQPQGSRTSSSYDNLILANYIMILCSKMDTVTIGSVFISCERAIQLATCGSNQFVI